MEGKIEKREKETLYSGLVVVKRRFVQEQQTEP